VFSIGSIHSDADREFPLAWLVDSNDYDEHERILAVESQLQVCCVMSTTRPWAKSYADDPVTKELLHRGINIPHHEDLHIAANGFLDPPFKSVLGQASTEALGMHHYTVHVKLGIAKEYVDELKTKLNTNTFNLIIDPSFTFQKLLSGFFSNLFACYDNLTQEIRLLFALGTDEKMNIFDALNVVREANHKVNTGVALLQEKRVANLFPIFQSVQTTLEKMVRYRNYLTHRKIVSSMAAVSASAPAMPLKWYELKGIIPPGASSFPLPSGTFTSFMQSGIGNTSGQAVMVHILQSTKLNPAKLFLPKLDKLDLLPTQLTLPNDLDERAITDVCDEFYTWTMRLLGQTYEVLSRDFRSLA